MAALQIRHCPMKFGDQFCKNKQLARSSSVSLLIPARKNPSVVVLAVASTISHPHIQKIQPTTMFQEFSLKPLKFVADQALVEDLEKNLKTRTDDEDEEEIEAIVQRLQEAVERVIELEIDKCMSKSKGQLSNQDVILMEEMSREIVSKFLEKPIQYLRSGNACCLQEKMKDLRYLVGILEESIKTQINN